MEYKFFYLCFHFPALYDPTSNTKRSLSQPKPCRQSFTGPRQERFLGAIPIPRSLARFPSNNRLDCVSFFFHCHVRGPHASLSRPFQSPPFSFSLSLRFLFRDGAAGIAPQRHPPARDDAGWGGPCCWARDARR